MDGENSWRGKSVSREKIAKFENEILLHKGQFIFILLRSLSPRVPSSSSKSSFFYAFFSLSIFIYNPLCVLMARKKGTSGGRSKRRKANLRWKNVFVHFVCVPEKPLFASVCLIEWNIFVTIVVFFVSWIYAQYIKLRSFESKMLDLSGGSVGGMKGEKAYKQAYISL